MESGKWALEENSFKSVSLLRNNLSSDESQRRWEHLSLHLHSEKNNLVLLFTGPLFAFKFNTLRSKTNMIIHFPMDVKAIREMQAGSSDYCFSDSTNLQIFCLVLTNRKSEGFLLLLSIEVIAFFPCRIGSHPSTSVSCHKAFKQIN